MPPRDIQLTDVQAVYSGPEWALWELLMGEQIHMGQQLAHQGKLIQSRILAKKRK